MIDPELLRKRPDDALRALARRGFALDLETFNQLDNAWRSAQARAEKTQQERNQCADEMAKAKRSKDEALAQTLALRGSALKTQSENLWREAALAEEPLRSFCALIPNLPLADVPDGADSSHNTLVRQVGDPAPLGFEAKTHDELGAIHRGLDFETAGAISGSCFVFSFGPIARLHRALIQFMLDTQVDENGYLETQAPYLVKSEALFGTGQLPKFSEDLFSIERDGLWLIPTAEVPVTNLVAGKIIPHNQLPMAFACHTPCFRREAGSSGKDTKGMIRQHQFEKVELVRFCELKDAEREFEKLLSDAESILKKLEIPYRVMALCAGDLGFSSEKTYDLEVWLPGQKAWREISSVSRFGDFQARRMKARHKDENGKNRLLCTLNGSGLAAGRALCAVLENFQQPDGSIIIPPVLRRHMNGMEAIQAPQNTPEHSAKPRKP